MVESCQPIRYAVVLCSAVFFNFSCKPRQEPGAELRSFNSKDNEPASDANIKNDLIRIQTNLVNYNEDHFSPKARSGRNYILSGNAIPFPLPMAAYRIARGEQTPEGQWLKEGALLHPSQFDAKQKVVVSLGEAVYTERGVELVTRTCFQCHAGTVAGMTVLGLPNNNFDALPLMTMLKKNLKRIDRVSAVKDAADYFDPLSNVRREVLKNTWSAQASAYVRDFSSYAYEFFMPPFDSQVTRGDNFGAFSVWYMAAKMKDPKRSGILVDENRVPSALEKLVVGTKLLPPVDSLPWWEVKFKERAYWFWDAPFHNPAAFNLNFYTPVASEDTFDPKNPGYASSTHKKKFQAKVDLLDEVLQYARETEPPALPEEARQDLVKQWDSVLRGKAIYEKEQCGACHGTYEFKENIGIEVTYPNTGLEHVGTDPEYNKILQRFSSAAEQVNLARSYYGAKYGPVSYKVDIPGYTSPTLVGIWASAPYFHNGSVPTLADILKKPSERPEIWARPISRPTAYDVTNLIGIDYGQAVSRDTLNRIANSAKGKAVDSPEAITLRSHYDTTLYGRKKDGHLYGVELEDNEKRDLIKFMMALSPIPEKGLKKIYPSRPVPTWSEGHYLDEEDPDMSHKDYKIHKYEDKISAYKN